MKAFKYIVALALMATAAHAEIQTALKVQVLIFSGRPDPFFWITDAAEIREILKFVSQCPPDASRKPAADARHRMYRGFWVKVVPTKGKAPDPEAFTVYRSELDMLRDNRMMDVRECRKDTDGVLEAKLIRLLETEKLLSPDVIEYIKTGKHLGRPEKSN